MNNTIPPMDDPMGKNWRQPTMDQITVSDTHAILGKRQFHELAEYSSSLPSGIYPGKMWKRQHGTIWLLCWFGAEADGMCPIYHRNIILQEAITLIAGQS